MSVFIFECTLISKNQAKVDLNLNKRLFCLKITVLNS